MLTHYIFVRRDLPIGVIAAMVTHAAGESAVYYDKTAKDFEGATAVVLEAKDESHLDEIAIFLDKRGIRFQAVYEQGGNYHGQFMAMGVVMERDIEMFKTFQTLKSCLLDNPPNGGLI